MFWFLNHKQHELCEEVKLLRHEIRKLMIAQAVLDASLKGLTVSVDAAVAALAAGDSTTSTPDTAVSAYQAGVDAQTLRLATATPPPTPANPALK
jgi:hypothetical protein